MADDIRFMIDYETVARNSHRSGMNCAIAVYDALCLGNDAKKTEAPRPRSVDGKCGAVLAAEQYIREMGGTDSDIEAFENSFTERYAYLTCAELRGKATGQCNDYVGLAASIAGRMGLA